VISTGLASSVILISLAISLSAYVFVSRHEGSYVNILTPATLVGVPALYLLPLVYTYVFQTEGTAYAYVYIYGTLAVQNVVFAIVYTRRPSRPIHLPSRFGYKNFWVCSVVCLILAAVVYVPVLLQFPQDILSPRQLYAETRTGFGSSSFTSATFAFLSVIFVLFSGRSRAKKGLVIAANVVVLSLHGSKGQILEVIFFVLLYVLYVKDKRFGLMTSLVGAACISGTILLLFAASMTLGESVVEIVQSVSEYSDYTRNDLLVIDSHMPPQFGRLILEANTISVIPRILMPSKPKNFGAFYLAEEFFPERFDADTGAPAFAIGVHYADFGWLAIVYLAIFSGITGWLARVCVNRLKVTHHPGDLVLVAFMADVTLFPVGGGGWFLPETLLVVFLVRYVSCLGANTVYREHPVGRRSGLIPAALPAPRKA